MKTLKQTLHNIYTKLSLFSESRPVHLFGIEMGGPSKAERTETLMQENKAIIDETDANIQDWTEKAEKADSYDSSSFRKLTDNVGKLISARNKVNKLKHKNKPKRLADALEDLKSTLAAAKVAVKPILQKLEKKEEEKAKAAKAATKGPKKAPSAPKGLSETADEILSRAGQEKKEAAEKLARLQAKVDAFVEKKLGERTSLYEKLEAIHSKDKGGVEEYLEASTEKLKKLLRWPNISEKSLYLLSQDAHDVIESIATKQLEARISKKKEEYKKILEAYKSKLTKKNANGELVGIVGEPDDEIIGDFFDDYLGNDENPKELSGKNLLETFENYVQAIDALNAKEADVDYALELASIREKMLPADLKGRSDVKIEKDRKTITVYIRQGAGADLTFEKGKEGWVAYGGSDEIKKDNPVKLGDKLSGWRTSIDQELKERRKTPAERNQERIRELETSLLKNTIFDTTKNATVTFEALDGGNVRVNRKVDDNYTISVVIGTEGDARGKIQGTVDFKGSSGTISVPNLKEGMQVSSIKATLETLLENYEAAKTARTELRKAFDAKQKELGEVLKPLGAVYTEKLKDNIARAKEAFEKIEARIKEIEGITINPTEVSGEKVIQRIEAVNSLTATQGIDTLDRLKEAIKKVETAYRTDERTLQQSLTRLEEDLRKSYDAESVKPEEDDNKETQQAKLKLKEALDELGDLVRDVNRGEKTPENLAGRQAKLKQLQEDTAALKKKIKAHRENETKIDTGRKKLESLFSEKGLKDLISAIGSISEFKFDDNKEAGTGTFDLAGKPEYAGITFIVDMPDYQNPRAVDTVSGAELPLNSTVGDAVRDRKEKKNVERSREGDAEIESLVE